MDLTTLFVVSAVCVITMFDIWQLATKGIDATISKLLMQAAHRWPIIPFALGVVCGHLFWTMCELCKP